VAKSLVIKDPAFALFRFPIVPIIGLGGIAVLSHEIGHALRGLAQIQVVQELRRTVVVGNALRCAPIVVVPVNENITFREAASQVPHSAGRETRAGLGMVSNSRIVWDQERGVVVATVQDNRLGRLVCLIEKTLDCERYPLRPVGGRQ
jgi:hypothetical protein